MYFLLFLIILSALGVLTYAGLQWMLAETLEDGAASQPPRAPRSFYNPRTWAAFHRLASRKALLLTYRRDRRGRFRKVR